jgi:hypothetical protein
MRHFAKNLADSYARCSEPVVVTRFSDAEWSVVTAEFVLLPGSKVIDAIAVGDIRRVSPVREENGQPIDKRHLNTLEINTSDDRSVLIRTDPGAAFSGLWNVLKTFERT